MTVLQPVRSVAELVAATHDMRRRETLIHRAIPGVRSLRLAPGQQLIGEDQSAALIFAADTDGLQLTTDNQVRHGIETFGATGESLVKGVVTTPSAIGLSVKPGGSARRVNISGGATTHAPGTPPLELLGTIEALGVDGGVRMLGDAQQRPGGDAHG